MPQQRPSTLHRVEPLEPRLAPALNVIVDYSLDSSGFFADPVRREVLEAAIDTVAAQLNDQFAPITVDPGNTYRIELKDPSSSATIPLENLTIPANTVFVFVGAQELGEETSAVATTPTLSARGSPAFLDLVFNRGQGETQGSAARDHAFIAGSISFDQTNDWFFGGNSIGLPTRATDFYSVAQHEFLHLLGFSLSDVFDNQITANQFTGPEATRVFGGPVPLDATQGHYAPGTTSLGAPALMNAVQLVGTRSFMTALDWAILADLGWELSQPAPSLTTLDITPSLTTPAVRRTLSATLTSNRPDIPTGTVTFATPFETLGIVPLAAGVAQLTTDASRFTLNNLTAIYSGDAQFTASGSGFAGPLPPPPSATAPPVPPLPVPPVLPVNPPISSLPGQNATPVVGVGLTGVPRVTLIEGTPPRELADFPPSNDGEGSASRVAVADVNGDGVAEVIVGSDPGQPTQVRVYDGNSLNLLEILFPFEASFLGGVFVAADDFTGDGQAEIIVTPDEGGGPRVRIFRVGDATVLADFFGIEDPNFRGGARPAVGDVNGDTIPDLLVAAGFGGGPRVAGFDGRQLVDPFTTGSTPVKLFSDFFVFEASLRDGSFVTIGDLDGDGFGDVIAGGGPGGGPRVLGLSGNALLQAGRQEPIINFFSGDPNTRGGIRVAAKDLDGDSNADLVTGSGTGLAPVVRGYRGVNLLAGNFLAPSFTWPLDPTRFEGVFVG